MDEGATSWRHKFSRTIYFETSSRAIHPRELIREIWILRNTHAFPVNDSSNSTRDARVHSIDSLARDAFERERIALLIRRAAQAAKCKPSHRLIIHTRHYQVYQMLMRGEARYSSICLNSPSRSSLTLGAQSPIANLNDSILSCISASDLAAYAPRVIGEWM